MSHAIRNVYLSIYIYIQQKKEKNSVNNFCEEEEEERERICAFCWFCSWCVLSILRTTSIKISEKRKREVMIESSMNVIILNNIDD
jgi:hypothetical protein